MLRDAFRALFSMREGFDSIKKMASSRGGREAAVSKDAPSFSVSSQPSVTRYIRHRGGLLGRGAESLLDDILDPFGPHETQAVAGAFRDVLIVLAITCGQNDSRQARTGGGDDFFLDTSDR